jgi:hypothetical protein
MVASRLVAAEDSGVSVVPVINLTSDDFSYERVVAGGEPDLRLGSGADLAGRPRSPSSSSPSPGPRSC